MLDHRFARSRLSDYVERELDASARRRIERHLDECPECDAAVRTLRAMLSALALLRQRVPAGVAEAVQARLRARWRPRIDTARR